MTAPTTVPPPVLEPGRDVDQAASFTFVRSAGEVAADVAVLAAPCLTALTGWAVTGNGVVLVVSGVVAAAAAMGGECLRRHV